jgi:hypothetical protein
MRIFRGVARCRGGYLSLLLLPWTFDHAGEMTPSNDDISPLVERLLPNASPAEKIDATENVRTYVAVLYRVFCRLESESQLPGRRDKNDKPAMVYTDDDEI